MRSVMVALRDNHIALQARNLFKSTMAANSFLSLPDATTPTSHWENDGTGHASTLPSSCPRISVSLPPASSLPKPPNADIARLISLHPSSWVFWAPEVESRLTANQVSSHWPSFSIGVEEGDNVDQSSQTEFDDSTCPITLGKKGEKQKRKNRKRTRPRHRGRAPAGATTIVDPSVAPLKDRSLSSMPVADHRLLLHPSRGSPSHPRSSTPAPRRERPSYPPPSYLSVPPFMYAALLMQHSPAFSPVYAGAASLSWGRIYGAYGSPSAAPRRFNDFRTEGTVGYHEAEQRGGHGGW
jgi:hypothetical protein